MPNFPTFNSLQDVIVAIVIPVENKAKAAWVFNTNGKNKKAHSQATRFKSREVAGDRHAKAIKYVYNEVYGVHLIHENKRGVSYYGDNELLMGSAIISVERSDKSRGKVIANAIDIIPIAAAIQVEDWKRSSEGLSPDMTKGLFSFLHFYHGHPKFEFDESRFRVITAFIAPKHILAMADKDIKRGKDRGASIANTLQDIYNNPKCKSVDDDEMIVVPKLQRFNKMKVKKGEKSRFLNKIWFNNKKK